MIKTARLNFGHLADSGKHMTDIIDDAIAQIGITKADIWIGRWDRYGPEGDTHFGNWCIVPALDNEALQKLATAIGGYVDYHQSVLEHADLGKFQIGDKVTLKFVSGFGLQVASEGRIVSRSDSFVTILKKRSRSKGWKIRVGDAAEIVKI